MKRLSYRAAVIGSSLVMLGGCERPEKPLAPASPTPSRPAPALVRPQAPAPATSATSSTARELHERLRCEALLGFRGVMEGQRNFFGEKDRWTEDLALLPVPAACADGSRVSTPDAGWLAGCHFRYAVRVAGTLPDDTTYSVRAVGVGGIAEGLTYSMTDGFVGGKPLRVWPPELVLEECHGVRRPEGAPLPAPLCEGTLNLRGLFTAQKAYFGERDRYSERADTVGFSPEPCLDGSRAPVPDAAWTAGCRFIYRAEVWGEMPAQEFRLTARGVTGTVAGQELTLDSRSNWSPAEPGCVP
ncbi:hypothetical protein [Corallococcus terminator]|uniref:Lipoprotein n=1 Tax=Corallococcus terminator TaxID=2316733 RepID=A0A3A8JE26_9BACT|nr:hypothetical protein [Corallococcus terminator]RKG93268.1 hypothetical protein D7V88_03255 [Corallococcus terminator]